MLKIAHDHFHHRLVRAYRPEFLKRHVHAGSFNIDPGIWHACSMNPCQPDAERGVVFVSPDMIFLGGGDVWVLGDPKFPAKKRKAVNGLAGAH